MGPIEVYLKNNSFKKVMNIFTKEDAKKVFTLLEQTGRISPIELVSFKGSELYVSSFWLTMNFDFIFKNRLDLEFLAEKEIVNEMVTTEVVNTLAIENIYTTREEVTDYLSKGYSMDLHVKNTASALKYIDECVANDIYFDKESVKILYDILTENTLKDNEQINDYYRDDKVYVVSSSGKKLHEGAPAQKIDDMMELLFELMNESEGYYSDTFVYIMIHFYIGYVHPYFDGNGRMARMLSAWYLLKKQVPKVFVFQFSKMINERKQDYYKAYEESEFEEHVVDYVVLDKFLDFFTDIAANVSSSRMYSLRLYSKFVEEKEYKKFTRTQKSILYTILNTKYNEEFSSGTAVNNKLVNNRTVRTALQKFEKLNIVEKVEGTNKYRLSTEFKILLEIPYEHKRRIKND